MYDTNVITEAAQERALRKAADRIKGIDRTTRDGVRARIREAIDQGMSPREAGQHVADWSGWDEYRAERIARTETMFAYNSAATQTYGQFGVTHVVADDGDKDEQCAARHGMVVTVEEAEDILDHPNGTLDWLPVAPGYDPRRVQEELSGVREVSRSQLVELPKDDDWVAPTSETWRTHPEAAAQTEMFQKLFYSDNKGNPVAIQFENSATAVNRYYRDGGKVPARWNQDKLAELDRIASAHTIERETFVYRGVQGSRGLPSVGEVFGDQGYTSLTSRYTEAVNYSRPGGQGRQATEGGEGFVYRVRLDPGQAYGGRLHPVLPRGTHYRVLRVRPRTDGRPAVVDVEVVR